MDEYFTSIRNIEGRLSKAQDWADTPFPKATVKKPTTKMSGSQELAMAFDLMHIALQSDSTRVLTYMLPSRGILKELVGGKINPHRMSHRGAGELDPKAVHPVSYTHLTLPTILLV